MKNESTTTEPISEPVMITQASTPSKGVIANKKLLTVAVSLGVGLLGALGYIVFDTIRDGNREETAYDERPQTSQSETKDNMSQSAEVNCSGDIEVTSSDGAVLSNEYFYFVDYGVKIKKAQDVAISYITGDSFNYATKSPASGITYFSCSGSATCFNTFSVESGMDTAFADGKHHVILGTMPKVDYEKELEAHQSYPGDKLLEVNGNIILLSTSNLDNDTKWQTRIDFLAGYIKDNISAI